MNHAKSALRRSAVLPLWLIVVAGSAAADDSAGKIDFNRDIRPILSDNCFQCHGPDDRERQAGLRLDSMESAKTPAESGQVAIVPGKPQVSELVARIYATDPDQRMPPVDSNKKLSEAQKGLLKRWIAEGAAARVHWSFVAPARPRLPAVTNRSWAHNEIDLFVLSRLEQENLTPAPEADRLTLIRRLYLDLVGLLPGPDEADAFAHDPRPEAYAELVDRLLDSPHYGERWARRWLDLARYADTNGYEKDRARSIWPYRDWVIRALNADMPFDRFTIEQIAGDLLSSADLNTRIATGFHRNTMVNEEGGIDVEEFRFQAVVDRVNTTGAVWLGLTIGCAQCHNHKFDPISQREYYQMFALLNNADEPEMEVPQLQIARQRESTAEKIAAIEKQRETQFDEQKFAAWRIEHAKSAQHWSIVAPLSATSAGHATMTVLPDQSVLVSGDKPNQDTYVLELANALPRVTGIRLEVLPHESLPEGGPGRAPLMSEGDFMLGEFALVAVGSSQADPPRPIALTDATQSHAAEKTSAALVIDGDLDTGWSIKGRTGQASQAVFRLAQPVEGPSKLRVTLDQRYIHQMTIGRFRLALTGDADPRASNLPAEVESILANTSELSGADESAVVKTCYLSTSPEFAQFNEQIVATRKSLPKQPTTLVMQERDAAHSRTTRRAHRGEFLSPREVIEPGVPGVLHPLPAQPDRNRLALARWLVERANPLVARVAMNRHWQAFFGRGLVRTTEDFGVRGEPPTHAELLDYLATEFVARKWSVKQMHRLIVTSATYRQSSRVSPDLRERDPENSLLARGPRFRVDAEIVRDMALCASGLLVGAVGGPSVFPPQPASVGELAWTGNSWQTSQGPDRYRRGLYTYLKRTSPYAAFMTFDGPSGENCMVRRERSNTPLQALTLLNDAVFVEASQALGHRAMGLSSARSHDRAAYLFRLCLTREPSREEIEDLERFYQGQLARLQEGQLDSKAIASTDTEPAKLHPSAAWTLVGRALLNLDEFVTKE
jgi:hypothetical protein